MTHDDTKLAFPPKATNLSINLVLCSCPAGFNVKRVHSVAKIEWVTFHKPG